MELGWHLKGLKGAGQNHVAQVKQVQSGYECSGAASVTTTSFLIEVHDEEGLRLLFLPQLR